MCVFLAQYIPKFFKTCTCRYFIYSHIKNNSNSIQTSKSLREIQNFRNACWSFFFFFYICDFIQSNQRVSSDIAKRTEIFYRFGNPGDSFPTVSFFLRNSDFLYVFWMISQKPFRKGFSSGFSIPFSFSNRRH